MKKELVQDTCQYNKSCETEEPQRGPKIKQTISFTNAIPLA